MMSITSTVFPQEKNQVKGAWKANNNFRCSCIAGQSNAYWTITLLEFICIIVLNYLTKQGSLRPFTVESGSYFSFFLDGQTDFTSLIPAWVFLISQYGESVSIIILSAGIPCRTSRFSLVFREYSLIPALVH